MSKGGWSSPQKFGVLHSSNISSTAAGRQALADCQSKGHKVEFEQTRICVHHATGGISYASSEREFVSLVGMLRSHWGTNEPPRSASENAPTAQVKPSQISLEAQLRSAIGRIALLEAEVAVNQQTIDRLRAAGRKIIEQRDSWERRALNDEREISKVAPKDSINDNADGQYLKFKRIIAKELHPDNQASGIEKIVKAEIFKVIWAKVEDIDKGG